MVLEFTTESLKTQVQGGKTVRQLTDLFSVPYPELYRAVRALPGPPGRISAGDRYWLELTNGSTVETIARKKGCSPAAVAKAVINCGYDLDAVEPVAGDWGYNITLSVRAIEAWRSLGYRAMVYFRQKLGETIELVETGLVIERMRLAEEKNGQIHLPLTPADFELIDKLVQNSETDWKTDAPQKGRAKIIRRLVEEMITTMPELAQYRPPAPLVFPAAYNNIGATWATTFMAPVYLWSRMEDLKGKRGGNSPNLSSFMRRAVQNLLDHPELVTTGPEPVVYRQPPLFDGMYGEPGEKWKFNLPVLTVTLLEQQKEPFIRIKKAAGLNDRGDLGRLLCKTYLAESGIDQTQLPGWAEYLEFNRSWAAGDREEVRSRLIGLERDGYVVNLIKGS
jgi:hypothetical protein